MKIVFFFALILCSVNELFGASWGNGGKSSKLNNPKFGTHYWIAYEGYRMASGEANLSWLKSNLNTFYIGTEAPDLGALSTLNVGGGYKDTAECHCVLFDKNCAVTNDRVAMRAQQEYDKASAALTAGDKQLAAFYAGAMAHYIGDLSQFMHIMGKKSHWGSEDQNLHHRYEEVIDLSISATKKNSTLLSGYIKKKNVVGNTADEIAVSVARFDETGGGTIRTPGWMYEQLQSYAGNGTLTDASQWDKKFLDQTGNNVNMAVNGISELLIELSK